MKPDFDAMNHNELERLRAENARMLEIFERYDICSERDDHDRVIRQQEEIWRLEYDNTRLRDQVIALLDAIDYFGLAHRSACAIALYPPSPCDCGMDVVIAELGSKGFLDRPSRNCK